MPGKLKSFLRPVVEGGEPEILRNITSPCCGLAIWRRQPQPAFQDWLDALAPENLPSLRMILPVRRVADAVMMACDLAAIPTTPVRRVLVEDVAAVSAIFAELMGAEMISLRLSPVVGDGCTRFHQDCVAARLLCAYRGPGTQYAVPDADGSSGPVHELATASVGVMRGKLWRGGRGPALSMLHRSPPVPPGEPPRLLLAIDPVQDSRAAGRRVSLH